MTVSNSSSQITLATNGSTGPFAFPFIGVSSADISVSSISSNGSVASLLSSQYTLTLNAANPNALWGVGGSVLLSSTPSYPNLLIQRNIPLTQQTSVQNQGNYYAQVTEQALDILCMEIQQVSARTTQFRGQWTTNTLYSVGDIVQDGANGNDTLNYYICEVANTSGTWSTDLANGDWAISVLAVVPSTNQNITLTGAVTGSGTTSITTTLATQGPNTVLTNASATSGSPAGLALAVSSLFGRGSTGNVADISLGSGLSIPASTLLVAGRLIAVTPFTSTGTWVPNTSTNSAVIFAVGGGGGGGGSGTTGSGGSGGAGGTTSVGSLINVQGGFGGSNGTTGSPGGAGGGITTATIFLPGSAGQNFVEPIAGGLMLGANGAPGIFGTGAGLGGTTTTAGGAAGANTGAGGGGAGGSTSTFLGGSGGGAGGTGITYTSGISGNYPVTIGAAGAVGVAGSSGASGGLGGKGLAIIFEFA